MRTVSLTLNWEQVPLQVRLKTLTLTGTLSVMFSDSAGDPAGGISLHFISNSVASYQIRWCTGEVEVSSPTPLKEGDVCTISRTEGGVLVRCQELEVVNYTLSEEGCEGGWEQYWRRRAVRFTVESQDTVSGFYRGKPG